MRNILESLTVATIVLLAFTQCNRDCIKSDACHLKGEMGPCLALIYGYYYDQQEKKCVEFGWGGCAGFGPLPPWRNVSSNVTVGETGTCPRQLCQTLEV